jgi:hypothetical protein
MFQLERNLVDSLMLGLGAALCPRDDLFKAYEVTNGTRVVDVALADTEHPKSVVSNWSDFAPGFRRLDGRKTSLLAIVWRERRISVQRLARMTWTCPDSLLAADIPEMDGASWRLGHGHGPLDHFTRTHL